MTADLVTFLRACIDEDERSAEAASRGPWTYGDIDSVAGGSLYDPDVMIASVLWDNAGEDIDPRIRRKVLVSEADANGAHIAAWDPARVLAEVASKRAILDLHSELGHLPCDAHDAWMRSEHCETLRALVLPYAGRAGFDPSWTS